MKGYWIFLIVPLLGCQTDPGNNESKSKKGPVKTERPEKLTICRKTHLNGWSTTCHDELLKTAPPDTSTFDTKIEIFDHSDKTPFHECNIYKKDGYTVQKVGNQWRSAPFEIWDIPNNIIEMGEKRDSYETFDSLMCEVGGNSAYDRYVFKRDQEGRVVQVKHYMAWFEMYDEDEDGNEIYYRDYTPDWFLGYRLDIIYNELQTEYRLFYEGKEWDETITNTYDNKGRLAKQERLSDDNRYVAFYYYFDDYRFNIQQE